MRNLVKKISDPGCYVPKVSAFNGFNNTRRCSSTAQTLLTLDEEYQNDIQRIAVEDAFGLAKNKFARFQKKWK